MDSIDSSGAHRAAGWLKKSKAGLRTCRWPRCGRNRRLPGLNQWLYCRFHCLPTVAGAVSALIAGLRSHRLPV